MALYIIVALSAFVGRRTGATAGAHYRMPLYPLPPVIVVVALAYVTYQVWDANPWQVIIALLALGLGYVYYAPYHRSRSSMRSHAPEEGEAPGEIALGARRRRAGPGMNEALASDQDGPVRRRARDHGVDFDGMPGRWNALTDVSGVEVGYATLPWIAETGSLSLPIGNTNTHAVGAVHRGILDWSLELEPALRPRWHLPVVGETWDGYLNDINGNQVTPETAHAALQAARGGPLAEGSVGGGTGMSCYAFKGGTGTSSREVSIGDQHYVVAILLQANFGSRKEHVIRGRALGRRLQDDNPMETEDWLPHAGAGSCIGIVATDAPLLPQQCGPWRDAFRWA